MNPKRFFTSMLFFGLALTFSIFSEPQVLVAATCVPQPSSLVSWWRMEGNANDELQRNPGTLTGSISFVPGEVGNGLYCAGPRAGIIVPSSSSVNFGPGADFSIEAWVRPAVAATSYGVMDIVDKRDVPDLAEAHGYELALSGGAIAFQICDQIGKPLLRVLAGPDLRDGFWHHVAVSVERAATNGLNLFVDGVLVATYDPTGQQGDLGTSAPLLIGLHPAYPSFDGDYRGAMDEVAIYSRALNAQEIYDLFAAGTFGKCGRPSINRQPRNQVAYWGQDVTFEVLAQGLSPLTYQWFKETFAIPSATNSALVISNVSSGDAGTYSVTVTDQFGSVTSSNAVLVVNPVGVSIGMYPGISIEGAIGRSYGVQYATNLNPNSTWLPITTVTLSQPVQIWFDTNAPLPAARFYRVLPLP